MVDGNEATTLVAHVCNAHTLDGGHGNLSHHLPQK